MEVAVKSAVKPGSGFRLLVWLVRVTLGRYLSVRCEGLEHLDTNRPYILACNHASTLDPILVSAYVVARTRKMISPVATKGLFFWPLRLLLHRMGAIAVDRTGQSNLRAVRRMLRTLRSRPILIFPEGRVMVRGSRGPGKWGVGYLAEKTGAPLIPAAIIGSDHALPRGGRWIRRSKVTLRFGEPISTPSRKTNKQPDLMTHRVMQAIGRLKGPVEEAHE